MKLTHTVAVMALLGSTAASGHHHHHHSHQPRRNLVGLNTQTAPGWDPNMAKYMDVNSYMKPVSTAMWDDSEVDMEALKINHNNNGHDQ